MKDHQRSWILISLFNLLIVIILGSVMRYKIGFSFPYLDQKNLQHAHSHFAFTGWITHTLLVLMIAVLRRDFPDLSMRKYRNIIITNLVVSYGMLFSFASSGYSPLSIGLSTASIFISYIFAVVFFRDLQRLPELPYRNWFVAGLWFNIISSLGTFTLGLMMATHNFDQKIHLASLYYYLHFQYNGFFLFVCMGLLVARLSHLLPGFRSSPVTFWLLCISCVPAYFLSTLWMKIPLWMFILVILSAFAQVVGYIMFWRECRNAFKLSEGAFKVGRYILLVLALALGVKFLLQLGSTIPSVSHMAFGFRPIIIAYLHLILLAIISVFLVWYFFVFGPLQLSKRAGYYIIFFVVAVYLNQLLLGVQGIASLSYTNIPQINRWLFIAAIIILVSVILLLSSQRQAKKIVSKTQFSA